MCVNACQKHIVQTKAISQCVVVCVCALFNNTLAELLSFPSNICYEFGPRPEQLRHMSERPDSPEQCSSASSAPGNLRRFQRRTGRAEFHGAAADFSKALIAFHPCGLNAGSTFLTSVKRKTSAPLRVGRLLPKC